MVCYRYVHDYIYLPTQVPDESKNVPSLQVSAVHTLGAAPRRVSEPLQVKQYAGLTGFEQQPQVSSHTVWSGCYKNKILYSSYKHLQDVGIALVEPRKIIGVFREHVSSAGGQVSTVPSNVSIAPS